MMEMKKDAVRNYYLSFKKWVLKISLLLFIYGIKACQVNILKIFTKMF
jgi:hypothetical protein